MDKDEKPKIKFFFKSERLDYTGKVKPSVRMIEIPWDSYDPKRMVYEAVISGDMSNFPKPFYGMEYSSDFMLKYSGNNQFDYADFKRYFSVESEPVINGTMKFVIYDRLGNNMKWVEV